MSNFQTEANGRVCTYCEKVTEDITLTHCPSCNRNLGNGQVVEGVLASGSGNGNDAVVGWFIFYLGMAALSFILAFTLGQTTVQTWSWQGVATETVRNEYFAIFLVIGVIDVIFVPLINSAISSTCITVKEDGISGRGISRWFYLGDVRRFDFMLTFDQVMVSAKKNHLVVHGAGTHYYVYCENPAAIQRAIHEQKTKPKTLAPLSSE
ncbi:MAG: hypothetical protein FWD97_03770 [Defluviitaleaceae bacterium]|nr:hypothetical protein [Defluviitaleaceae bacterium]